MHIRFGDPAILFCLLSLIFGFIVIAINPPLRGPDESAHFLRIYSITQGEIIPTRTDERGRRGFMLGAQAYADFSFFEIARSEAGVSKVGLRELLKTFATARAEPETNTNSIAVFQPYGGSEAYSPAPYLPYIAVGLITRLFGFDFLSTLYVMRVAGVVSFTAMAAYAILMTPHLKWAFFIIAMLPSAFYSRAVLSADGAALSATLVVVALCLRAAKGNIPVNAANRAVWMTLCVLAKPAQTAFVLLEGMTSSFRNHFRRLHISALVVLPGLALTAAWLMAGSADVASWRIEGTGASLNEFDPGWKLRFMLEHPLHFPKAAIQTLDYSVELWRQLIGVLGWLDTYLVPAAYPLLTALTLVTFIERFDMQPDLRYRIAFWSCATMLAYTLAIFLIFYLTWTPTSAGRILGIQGRYFIVLVPTLAVFTAALINRALPLPFVKGCAIVGALVSGSATIVAILRVNW